MATNTKFNGVGSSKKSAWWSSPVWQRNNVFFLEISCTTRRLHQAYVIHLVRCGSWSSAKRAVFAEVALRMLPKWIRKRRGPKTHPCRTEEETGAGLESLPSTRMWTERRDRYLLNHWRSTPHTPRLNNTSSWRGTERSFGQTLSLRLGKQHEWPDDCGHSLLGANFPKQLLAAVAVQ